MSPQLLQSEQTVSSFAKQFPLASAPVHTLVQELGGIDPLIAAMRENGLGSEVATWLESPKKPKPITPEQVRRSLSPNRIAQLASATGLSEAETESILARYLPRLIHHYGNDLKALN